MTHIRTFQALVIISIVIYLGWFALPYIPVDYPPATAQLLRFSGYGASQLIQHPLFYYFVLFAKLAAAIGLFFFLSWGRWLFLGALVISLAVIPFGGVSVSPPFDSFIGALNGLTDGAIIALSFSSL